MTESALTDPPVITVAMPIYNAGIYLRPALCSILAQEFQSWELLLIDDGSTDDALAQVADILIDQRIRVLRDGLNKGLAARLNEAIDMARGEFIARMDQDDISYPRRFTRQLAVMRERPDLDLVGCRCLRISADDRPVGLIPFAASHGELVARRWRGIHLAHPSWFARTSWFRKYHYAQPGPYCTEDQELLLRASGESTYATLPDVLFAYRVRDSLPWRKTLRTRRTLLGIQLRHFFRQGELLNASLALATFLINVPRDMLKVLLRRQPFANGCGEEAPELSAQFSAVLTAIGK